MRKYDELSQKVEDLSRNFNKYCERDYELFEIIVESFEDVTTRISKFEKRLESLERANALCDQTGAVRIAQAMTNAAMDKRNVTLVAYPPDITIVADSKTLDGATVSAIITKLITETGMSAQDATDMLERIKCEIQNKAFSNPVKG
jgi:hypothetical protein